MNTSDDVKLKNRILHIATGINHMAQINFINRYKSQTKDVSAYLLASIIPAFISLLVNPLIAKNMSPEDYAIVGFYTSFSLLLTPLISFYLNHYLGKRFYECDVEGRKQLKATILRIFLVISPVLSLLALSGIWVYKAFFNEGSAIPFFPYSLFYVCSIYLAIFYSLEQMDMKMHRKSGVFLRLALLHSVLIVGSTLLLVVLFKFGAIGKMLATVIESFILFIIVVVRNKELLSYSVSTKEIKVAMSFCLPLVLAAMLSFFTKGYDSVLLERLGNTKEFALYSIGLQFSAYLGMFTTAIQNTFQSDIYEAVSGNNRSKLFKLASMFLIVSAIVVLLFCLFAPFIVKVLTMGRYTAAAKYARICSLSLVFSVFYYFVSTIFIARGHNKMTLINKITIALISMFAFPFMINHYQYVGAGITLSIIFLLSTINLYFINFIYKNVGLFKNRR